MIKRAPLLDGTRGFLLAAVVAASAACAQPSAANAAGESPAAAETPADPAKEACDAETVKLQAGLDAADRTKKGAVLAVKTPACGLRVLTSGASTLTPSMLHRVGSVTKTYVGALILDLASDGALSIDEPISKFQLGVPSDDAITVRHLLNHTSGLFNYTEDGDFMATAVTTKTVYAPSDLVATAVKHSPYFEPGKGWHYSNTNFILLGMIAEKVGGARVSVLLRQRVLDRAGLTSTFFEGEEPVGGELAHGFSRRGLDLTDTYGTTWSWSAGAMVASPADVVRWIELLGSGAFHDPETQKAMMTTVRAIYGSMRYGLAIMAFDEAVTGGMGPGIGHDGDIPGYHTLALYFPERSTTLVAIVDSDADDHNELSVAAIDVLTDAP